MQQAVADGDGAECVADEAAALERVVHQLRPPQRALHVGGLPQPCTTPAVISTLHCTIPPPLLTCEQPVCAAQPGADAHGAPDGSEAFLQLPSLGLSVHQILGLKNSQLIEGGGRNGFACLIDLMLS